MSYPPGYPGQSVPGIVPAGMHADPSCGRPISEPRFCMPHTEAVRPPSELDECFRALGEHLEGTLQMGTLEPRITPPYRSRYIHKVVRGVIAVPAAYDATAFAGSLSLALAITSVSGTTGPLALFLVPTETAPPFSPQTMLVYETDPGHVAVFKSIGLTVQNSVPEAANVIVEAQGPNYGSDNPSALTSGAPVVDHQDTLLVVPENRRLTIKVQNLDVSSGIAVTLSVTGWQFPIRTFKDSLKSLISQPGYGRECLGG